MPFGPFSISKDFIHGTEDGCLRVTAMPHIILYRIPHDFAQNLMAEKELKQAGIYLLMNTKADTIYVGQADSRDNGNGVLGRMLEPHTKKNEIDQWDVGYVLTNGTPTFFGATELNWLEQFFYDEALKAGRYALLNGNRPHASEVSFTTKTLLKNYVDFAFFLLRVEMDCDAFEEGKKKPATSQKASTTPQNYTVSTAKPFFIHNAVRDAHAEAIRTDDNKMIVKKGTQISSSSNLANQKGQDGREKLRNQLILDGTIKDRIFTVDYSFASPSAAATVILGTSSSGNDTWKSKSGISLGEILGKKE